MQSILEKQETRVIATVPASIVFDSAPLEQQISTAVGKVSRFESQAYVDNIITQLRNESFVVITSVKSSTILTPILSGALTKCQGVSTRWKRFKNAMFKTCCNKCAT